MRNLYIATIDIDGGSYEHLIAAHSDDEAIRKALIEAKENNGTVYGLGKVVVTDSVELPKEK